MFVLGAVVVSAAILVPFGLAFGFDHTALVAVVMMAVVMIAVVVVAVVMVAAFLHSLWSGSSRDRLRCYYLHRGRWHLVVCQSSVCRSFRSLANFSRRSLGSVSSSAVPVPVPVAVRAAAVVVVVVVASVCGCC